MSENSRALNKKSNGKNNNGSWTGKAYSSKQSNLKAGLVNVAAAANAVNVNNIQ